jgi:hypothetical protein
MTPPVATSYDAKIVKQYRLQHYITDLAGGAVSGSALSPNSLDTPLHKISITATTSRIVFVRYAYLTGENIQSAFFPSSGYAGPFTISGTGVTLPAIPTPPPAPTLGIEQYYDQGYVNYDIVGSVSYAKPAIFFEFQWHYYDGVGPLWHDEYSYDPTVRLKNAVQGRTYQVSIRVNDIHGRSSSFSSATIITIPTLVQPPPPQAPVAVAMAIRAIRLTWPAILNGTTYGEIVQYNVFGSNDNNNFYYLASVDASNVLPQGQGAPIVQYIDTDLNVNLDYVYRISVTNANGTESGRSGSSNVITDLVLTMKGDIAADQIYALHVHANEITAGKLEANLVLATTIQAVDGPLGPGRIYAGGEVLLHKEGIVVNSGVGIRFRSGDLISGTVVAYIGTAVGWQGTGLSGMVIQTSAGTSWGRLFIASNSVNDSSRFLMLSDSDVRMFIGGAVRAGVSTFNFFNGDGVWRLSPHRDRHGREFVRLGRQYTGQ